jgi:hypothetical protein
MVGLAKTCPVCGYQGLDSPPYKDLNGGNPSYEVCVCCGYEFGFNDMSKGQTFKGYRIDWINNGFLFFMDEYKPALWNKEVMMEQLKNTDNLGYKPRLRKKK